MPIGAGRCEARGWRSAYFSQPIVEGRRLGRPLRRGASSLAPTRRCWDGRYIVDLEASIPLTPRRDAGGRPARTFSTVVLQLWPGGGW